MKARVFASLLAALATAAAQSRQTPDEIQCLARCEASTTCQSVFTNANTGECQNYDCRFTKKPEPGWTYAEAAAKPNPSTCPDNIPVPSGITPTAPAGSLLPTSNPTAVSAPSKTSSGGAPAGPTNAAPRSAQAGAGAAVWAVGGLLWLGLC